MSNTPFSRRFLLTALGSAVGGAVLSACGGGGSESPPNPAFPAYAKGGTILVASGTMTITFDLSQGHLLGLATKDVNDPKKDDPTRRIKPEEVKEVVYGSVTLGGPEVSPARAPWNVSGIVTLPSVAGSDGGGYFFVVLKSGEAIAFAMGPDLEKSRYAVTGTGVAIGANGALSYGNYQLGKLSFQNPTTVRIAFGSDVLAGFSGFARPADVSYLQWNSADTGWLGDAFPRTRSQIQVGQDGLAFCDVSRLPNNSQGLFTLHLKNGQVLYFNTKSTRWESLGGMERVVVDAQGNEHLRYGGYRQGSITRPTPNLLRIDCGVDILPVSDEGTQKLVDVSALDVSYVQYVSALMGWYESPVKGPVLTLPNGDFRIDLQGIPVADPEAYIMVFLKTGKRLFFNTKSPRFATNSSGILALPTGGLHLV